MAVFENLFQGVLLTIREELIHRLWADFFMIILIDDDRWGITASPDAFHFFDAEPSVITGRTCMDAQFGLGVFKQFFSTD